MGSKNSKMSKGSQERSECQAPVEDQVSCVQCHWCVKMFSSWVFAKKCKTGSTACDRAEDESSLLPNNWTGLASFQKDLEKRGAICIGQDLMIKKTLLERGGNAVVFEGLLTKDKVNVDVAVKFPTDWEEGSLGGCHIQEELKIYSQGLPFHDNVIRCYNEGQHDQESTEASAESSVSCAFIVLERMSKSLNHVIHDKRFARQFTVKDIVMIFKGIVQGLKHLHNHRVVHYDLKPLNIMFKLDPFQCPDRCPKLSDFGCSRQKLDTWSTRGSIKGSLAYMPPELLQYIFKNNEGTLCSHAIDVFSLGVIMWEATTREIPHWMPKYTQEDDPSPRIVERFPLSNRVPQELADLIRICLNSNPDCRPSLEHLERQLNELEGSPLMTKTIQEIQGIYRVF